ncbi:unnamed protein product [Ambrosiozyma monospora]|uniref:Unnamed protein product n=1 Tax=Ambrosiozyma monospora TaxID=43982 RepID=A0ACB5SW69_AMBMO|nr:unnamed protein product [Ambrosiozyma monospora]
MYGKDSRQIRSYKGYNSMTPFFLPAILNNSRNFCLKNQSRSSSRHVIFPTLISKIMIKLNFCNLDAVKLIMNGVSDSPDEWYGERKSFVLMKV